MVGRDFEGPAGTHRGKWRRPFFGWRNPPNARRRFSGNRPFGDSRGGWPMRLRTNFSFPFEKLIPALTGLGWLGAVAGFFMAVVMAAGALQFQRENPGLKDELDQLQKNPVTESPRESQPSVDELDGLRRRLKDLNSLHAGGGASVTSLLAGLESILPPGARLLSLQ